MANRSHRRRAWGIVGSSAAAAIAAVAIAIPVVAASGDEGEEQPPSGPALVVETSGDEGEAQPEGPLLILPASAEDPGEAQPENLEPDLGGRGSDGPSIAETQVDEGDPFADGSDPADVAGADGNDEPPHEGT